jgi:hypothetical protein
MKEKSPTTLTEEQYFLFEKGKAYGNQCPLFAGRISDL